MNLSIQLHLAELSLPNTVSILYKFDAEPARSTVHNWIHKADLQPENECSSDHVAADETVIRTDDKQYFRNSSVDTETN